VLLTATVISTRFLRGRRRPQGEFLGPVDQGWTVSTTTLMYERHSTGARNPSGR